ALPICSGHVAPEVGLHPEHLGVPRGGGGDVVGEDVDGGESSQHGGSPFTRWLVTYPSSGLKCSPTEHFPESVFREIVAGRSWPGDRGREIVAGTSWREGGRCGPTA